MRITSATARMRLIEYGGSADTCIELDPHTGAYSRVRLATPRKGRAGYSGAAQVLRSIGEGKVLVAQYRFANDAWIYIGGESWRQFDESLVIRHDESWVGLVCELSLHRDGRCLRRLRYWRRDWHLMLIDSTYDQLDFSLMHLAVDFVPLELTSRQKQRADFIAMWDEG